jgi:ssDNA-binding Zn-finger/Zn-ribbon topoisomerase 1
MELKEGEVCPKCGSDEILVVHRYASWTAPECDYKVCGKCDHQWGHE